MEVTVVDKTLGPVTILSARRHNNCAVTVRFRSEAGELMAILFDTPTHIAVFDPSYPNLEYRHLTFEAPIRLALKIGGF